MQPDELYDILAETAVENLGDLFEDFENGSISTAAHVHAYLTLFRQLGVCRLFASGMPDDLFASQQQSASGYLFRLPTLELDDQAVSVAGVFWDAIGGQYWDAAKSISLQSRDTWNPKREHEEDFLYVRFLMKRYFLDADQPEQDDMLVRWAEVIEEELSPQLNLCRALLDSEVDDILEGLERLCDQRAADIARKIEAGSLDYDISAWLRPYWNQGLALIRLIEREGIEVPPMIPQVPDIVRSPCPYRYSPNSWRSADFRPIRESPSQ